MNYRPRVLFAFDAFSGGSTSSSTDARAGGSDQAKVVTGKGATLTTDHAKGVSGKKAKLVESGGVDLSGSKGSKVVGTDFSGVKDSTLNYTVNSVDKDIVQAALDQVQAANEKSATTITALIDANQASQSATASQSNQILDTFATKLSTATETKQTDGLSPLLKTALWALGLGVLGLAVWRMNK